MYADEVAGGTLFHGLADYADEQRRAVFLQLAEAEERHTERWSRLLRATGVEPRRPERRSTSACCASSPRHFGTEAVLPLMLRTEAAEADRYRDDAEAAETMAQQEAAAAEPSPRCRASRPVAASRAPRVATAPASATRPRFCLRHQRRPGLQLLARDGRRRRHARRRHRDPRRRGRAGGGRVSRWRPVSGSRSDHTASCTRTSFASNAKSCRAFPEEERAELEMIYRAKGVAPRRRGLSSTTSCGDPTSRSTRSLAKSSDSTRTGSAHRWSPRRRRSSPSRSVLRSR